MTWCLAHPKPIGNTCSWPHQRHHLHSCQKRNPGSNVSTSQINTCVYITSFKQRNKRERLLTYEQTYITISPRSLMVKMNTEEAVRAKFWRGQTKPGNLLSLMCTTEWGVSLWVWKWFRQMQIMPWTCGGGGRCSVPWLMSYPDEGTILFGAPEKYAYIKSYDVWWAFAASSTEWFILYLHSCGKRRLEAA